MLVGFEEMAMCWDRYVHNLTMASIILRTKDIDVDGKIEKGLITFKEAYRYIKQVQQGSVEWGWFRKIWTWKLPLKLKCFGWLDGSNELLTWDNLCCRGFTEPGRFFRVRQLLRI